MPLNEKPLDVLTFEDSRLTFGVERCYGVSTVDTFTFGQTAESAPSAVACVTPLDTFPPRAPAALDAIASEGQPKHVVCHMCGADYLLSAAEIAR